MSVATTNPGHIGTRPGQERPRRWSWTAVLLTSLALAAFSLSQYTAASLETLARQSPGGVVSTYVHRPVGVQVALYLHIGFSSVALLLGPLQFIRATRRRWPALHRWTGRTYLACVAGGSAAALALSLASSVAFTGFFGFGTLAVLWAWTGWRAWRAIRARDLPDHQAWMTRNFALTYAAVTLRLEVALLVAVQFALAGGHLDPAAAVTTAYAPLPFLAWIPNLVVAEYLLRRRGLPALRLVRPAG